MAFFTPTAPISGITGPLGKIDRTIKAGTGLAVKFVRRNGKWSLEQKTAATKTNSTLKQEQADRYFKCDCKWKKLSPACRLEIQKTQMTEGSPYEKTLPVYHYFMRYCLFGTECDKYLFYNCLETAASYTDEGDYLDIRGWNVNGICHLKSRLILNGQVHEEKISGNNGHVQFILSKDDLEDQNDIYVQICYKLSNVLTWSIWGHIRNGDFETGNTQHWAVSQHRATHAVNGTARHTGSYGFYAELKPNRYDSQAWISLQQTIDVTDITTLAFWHKIAYKSKKYYGNKLSVYLDGTLIRYIHDKPTPWRYHSINISSYTGIKTLNFHFHLWCPWADNKVVGKQYLDDILMS